MCVNPRPPPLVSLSSLLICHSQSHFTSLSSYFNLLQQTFPDPSLAFLRLGRPPLGANGSPVAGPEAPGDLARGALWHTCLQPLPWVSVSAQTRHWSSLVPTCPSSCLSLDLGSPISVCGLTSTRTQLKCQPLNKNVILIIPSKKDLFYFPDSMLPSYSCLPSIVITCVMSPPDRRSGQTS